MVGQLHKVLFLSPLLPSHFNDILTQFAAQLSQIDTV